MSFTIPGSFILQLGRSFDRQEDFETRSKGLRGSRTSGPSHRRLGKKIQIIIIKW